MTTSTTIIVEECPVCGALASSWDEECPDCGWPMDEKYVLGGWRTLEYDWDNQMVIRYLDEER